MMEVLLQIMVAVEEAGAMATLSLIKTTFPLKKNSASLVHSLTLALNTVCLKNTSMK